MTRLHRAHTHTPQQHSLCLHNLGLNCLPTLLSERERLSPHRRAKDLSLISARQTRTDNNKRNTGASDSSHSEDTAIYDMFDLPARLPAIFLESCGKTEKTWYLHFSVVVWQMDLSCSIQFVRSSQMNRIWWHPCLQVLRRQTYLQCRKFTHITFLPVLPWRTLRINTTQARHFGAIVASILDTEALKSSSPSSELEAVFALKIYRHSPYSIKYWSRGSKCWDDTPAFRIYRCRYLRRWQRKLTFLSLPCRQFCPYNATTWRWKVSSNTEASESKQPLWLNHTWPPWPHDRHLGTLTIIEIFI